MAEAVLAKFKTESQYLLSELRKTMKNRQKVYG
jgi:hypothetical protein